MYGDLSSEDVHCPNCNEDVPKTLYCLNCGYPLYKIEQEEKAKVQPEAEPEALEVVAPEEPEVDMSIEIEQPEETFVLEEPEPEIEIETTIEVEEVVAEEETLEQVEPEIHVEELKEEPIEPEMEEELVEAEPVLDMETEVDILVEEEELELEPEPEGEAIEEPLMEELEAEEPVVEEPEIDGEAPLPEVEEEQVIMEPEKPEKIVEFMEEEPELMEAIRLDFAPDPLTKEVMDNLAKNITLKIRLVRLLRDGQVKEETFKKLFDSYVEQGRIWVSRRDDTVRRFKADIERMEESLVTARKDFELLEIRRNIGDADDEEYKVKAPAYNWDIEHLDVEIKNRKGGVLYVANLRKLVPEEEIIELEKMADTDYGELDKLEDITADTIAKMKETLAES
ncbi:zinc ribbon domain-containing protein, partial [Candidatus Bathyarchaeota archaeon]|nr:zinc ribbon domain-containing protein [Candidatus Bathyarchaeota archaeon]